MGVLNDGWCYSSCEVFSGSIQGHGAGTIFGEDGQTGGGGAAVLRLDPILIHASPADFQRFPFSQSLPVALEYTQIHSQLVSPRLFALVFIMVNSLRIWVSRQILFFVPGGLICSPTPTTNTQYDRIAASLARTGRKNVEAAGIEEFTVFQDDGKTVAAKKRRVATKKQKFSIPVSTVGSALGNSQITIVGKTAGKQVLKTNRNVRFIPADDKYIKIGTTGFTFTGISDSVGLYQSSTTAPADGWNNLNGLWMIGTVSNMLAVSILPLRLSSLLPLEPRSILVSMSLLTLRPNLISSTCLSRAAAVVEDFLLSSKSLMAPRRSMGSLEGT
ncbi:hypothetical protein BASA62_006862 [Batrachochytrium salamandrivorans]|nr:hypothetical protein BASA62_006862 [Batrachochytrium salamandrivorans]